MTDKDPTTAGAQIDLDRLTKIAEYLIDSDFRETGSELLELIALARAGQQAGDTAGDLDQRMDTLMKGLRKANREQDVEDLIRQFADIRSIMGDELADLRAQLASAQSEIDAYRSDVIRLERDRDADRSALASAQKDAERYTAWRDAVLRDDWQFVECMQNLIPDDENISAAQWDTAIDAARAQLTNTTGN